VNGITYRSSELLLGLTEAFVVLALTIGIVKSLLTKDIEPARVVILAGLWLAVPIAVAYSISIHITPVFLERYFLLCLPALNVLLAYSLSVIPVVPLGYLGCALLIALRAPLVGSTYNFSIDNWRAATVRVLNESAPGDCVAFYFNDGFIDFAYYLEHPPAGIRSDAPIPRSVLPAFSFGSDPTKRTIGSYPAIVESYQALDPSQIKQTASSCPDLFVLSNHDGHNSASAGSRRVWSRFVTMRNGLESAYGNMDRTNIGSIAIYRFSHSALIANS